MCDALMEIFQEEIAVKVEEGRQEGREEGREEGVILGAIETMRDDGRNDKDILARLMKKYSLSREDAEAYLFAKI